MEELRPLTDRHAGELEQVPAKLVATLNKGHRSPSNCDKQGAKRSFTPGQPRASYSKLSESFTKTWKYIWFMEILSLVLAIIALIAIYITLTIHNDRPMPEWPKLISINTLISIFTAILKASLMMPVAEGKLWK
jgi:hypothetical protein